MMLPASWEARLLIAAIALFIAYLTWKALRGSLRRQGAPPAASAARVRALIAEARGTPDGAKKAACFREAAALLERERRKQTAAAGYLLRALHADPGSPQSLATVQALWDLYSRRGRHERLERTLWRLVAMLPDQGSGREAYARAWTLLADLYAGPLRRPRQAEAIRRVAERLASDSKS